MSKAEELYINEVFSDFLENGRTSGGEVSKAYNEYISAFENYVVAVQEDIFREAYMYFKANVEVLKE